MRNSYAISWNEDDGPRLIGVLELLPRMARLRGPRGAVDVPYEDMKDVRIARPARVLELPRRDGHMISVRTLEGLGTLNELADRIARRRGE